MKPIGTKCWLRGEYGLLSCEVVEAEELVEGVGCYDLRAIPAGGMLKQVSDWRIIWTEENALAHLSMLELHIQDQRRRLEAA